MHSVALGSLSEFLDRLSTKPLYLGAIRREYELTRHVMANPGRIVYAEVEGVKGHVYSNLLPSRSVLYEALGAGSDREAYAKLLDAMHGSGAGLVEDSFEKYFRRVEDSWLHYLPLIKYYEGDGGYYLTSTIFIACSNGVCNASIHRVMFRDDYVAVRVVPRHLYRMLSRAKNGLPVAIIEGVHPLVTLAAALSPPYGVFELQLASSILGKPLAVCRTPNYKLPIPCGASVVIEAVLGPERRPEGPFVDILGLYDQVREEPVLHIKSVYVNREEPLHHAIVPASTEHMILMGFPREAQIYEQASRVADVVKVRLTPQAGMWLHAVVSIRKRREGEAVAAGLAALAGHPSLKHVVVVDDDIDPDDPCSVEWAIATRVQAGRDIIVIQRARGSSLDPSSEDGLTDKLIIDATAPLGSPEKYRRPSLLRRLGGCHQASRAAGQ